ncbi:MAG: LysM peptidoglycan-binding domain-containing protein, partial [Clostridiales bacterium]|nr:LysM peptidoglycan-binding domain-containing protein [Clostridiales bacterium]
TDRVNPGEDLARLSARLRVPGCMLLRANRLYGPAWLTPGREISVPGGDFCRLDRFACPVEALRTPAAGGYLCRPGDTRRSIAAKLGLPDRLVALAGPVKPGARLALPRGPGRVVTALPGDSMSAIAASAGMEPEALRRVNRLWGDPLPGMRIWIPEKGAKESDE